MPTQELNARMDGCAQYCAPERKRDITSKRVQGRDHREGDTRGPLEMFRSHQVNKEEKGIPGDATSCAKMASSGTCKNLLVMVRKKMGLESNVGPDKEGLLCPFSCAFEQENVLNT